MKWYTGINDAGLPHYSEHLRAALSSAISVGGLDAHILFDGEPNDLFAAMGRSDFTVHRCRTGIWNDIQAQPPVSGWSPQVAAGAYLRLEIPSIERDDEFVLYTDNDVLFTRKPDLSHVRPRIAAAAVEPVPGGWKNRCSGVLVLNLPALRREYDEMIGLARATLGTSMYDQDVYNIHLEDKWGDLPLEAHWKPYWGVNPSASIVHFNGPKFHHIRELASKDFSRLPPSHLLSYLYGRNPVGCRYYAKIGEYLGDGNSPSQLTRAKLMLMAAPLYATWIGARLPL